MQWSATSCNEQHLTNGEKNSTFFLKAPFMGRISHWHLLQNASTDFRQKRYFLS
jgi:hypothetical protein